MTDLVTDAAIDAASEAVFANRGLSDDPLIPVLNAAAPHIAAEALRQAAYELDGFPMDGKPLAYITGIENTITYLSSRADDCDRAAATGIFTDIVRLGQELERE